ncbi:MAG: peptidase MA family metallohydrolase [Bellilinea sp.]|nr:peptidase MA family metallohydrolase [Bellilinea sp.]
MTRKSILLFVLLTTLISGWTYLPQQNVGEQLLPPEIAFGRSIRFNLILNQYSEVQSAYVLLKSNGQETLIIPFPSPLGELNQAVLDLTAQPLRPFTTVEYWYRLELKNGNSLNGEKAAFLYEDNRVSWQRLSGEQIKIAWQQGDLVFGQQALDVAMNSLQSTLSILDAPPQATISIYIYPSAKDLQSVLNLNPNSWVAGHASPDLGVILLSIPPGPDQRAEMERQIPHELMHILQYQLAGEAYTRLPIWLKEGLASMAELYPNPEYQRVLKKASENDTLLPFVNLCSSFPAELSGAILSYAQSASFVRFLYQNYGASSLRELIIAYKDGLGCEEGVRKVYQQSIAQLETRWRQESLGMDLASLAWSNLQPYLLILLLFTLPIFFTIFSFGRKRVADYVSK